jgi:hypothetical protein
MAAKFQISLGSFQLDYESDAAISFADLKDLLAYIKANFAPASAGQTVTEPVTPDFKTLTIDGILAKTRAKTMQDFILSAAAYLYFVKNLRSFTENDITAVLQGAPTWGSVYTSGSIATDLAGLTPNMLEDVPQNPGTYILSDGALSLLRSLLMP